MLFKYQIVVCCKRYGLDPEPHSYPLRVPLAVQMAGQFSPEFGLAAGPCLALSHTQKLVAF